MKQRKAKSEDLKKIPEVKKLKAVIDLLRKELPPGTDLKEVLQAIIRFEI